MAWSLIAIAIGGGLLTFRYVYKNLPRFTNIAPLNGSSLHSTMGTRFSRTNLHGFEPQMTLSEACSILNISVTTPKEKIREAHKQLMMRNHPDNGGSTYLASKVNEAKDFLIK